MPVNTTSEVELEEQPSPPKRSKLDSPSKPDEVVAWPIDDPSEFRPEYKTEMGELGKEKEQFRIFVEVRSKRLYINSYTRQGRYFR